MKTTKDRWAMLTPEQQQQNTILANLIDWREEQKKRKQREADRQFRAHFNSIGDRLEAKLNAH